MFGINCINFEVKNILGLGDNNSLLDQMFRYKTALNPKTSSLIGSFIMQHCWPVLLRYQTYLLEEIKGATTGGSGVRTPPPPPNF